MHANAKVETYSLVSTVVLSVKEFFLFFVFVLVWQSACSAFCPVLSLAACVILLCYHCVSR